MTTLLCKIEGCGNRLYSKERLCQKHYREMLLEKRIETGRDKFVKSEFCTVEGCEARTKYNNMCGKHYKRMWRHGDTGTVLTTAIAHRQVCKVEYCGKVIVSRELGVCFKHYQRLRSYGRIETVIAPKGEGTINAGGYRVLTINGKNVYEHIHLAERALGRKLPYKAVVHHMNGDPSDNFTPFNLVICQDQAYHLLLHRRARELEKQMYSKGESLKGES